MYFIETERLKLIPLTNAHLLLLHQHRHVMEESMGLNSSAMQMEQEFISEIQDALINFWIPKTEQNPDRFQWYTNWEIIDKSDNVSIGGMGFIGYPDQQGETEMGYCFDSKVHNKGYGTETLQALTRWAFQTEDCKRIKVATSATNIPSQRILEKAGFQNWGETREIYLVYQLDRPL
jgi:[ribosomal protein S5]-alanine N-acetyltransferase